MRVSADTPVTSASTPWLTYGGLANMRSGDKSVERGRDEQYMGEVPFLGVLRRCLSGR